VPGLNSEPRELATFYARYQAQCNEHRFNELAEFVAEDVNGPSAGLTRYVADLQAVIEGFPDYHWSLQRLLIDGQWLTAHLEGSGTHTGRFAGVAATGRNIRTQELVIYRVVAGKIVACWGDMVPVVRDALISLAPDL
jgi:predicted ester cyclase